MKRTLLLATLSISMLPIACTEEVNCEDEPIVCVYCIIPGPTSNTIIDECVRPEGPASPQITEEDLIQLMEQAIADGGECQASYDYLID